MLYYDPDVLDGKNPSSHKLNGIDLNRYDGEIVFLISQNKEIMDFSMSVEYPYKDELDLAVLSYVRLLIKRRSDGLYDMELYLSQEGRVNSFYFYCILGIKKMTNTMEVSTMSVTPDQPISAGNLKAALDGLTGGGRS